MPTTVGLSSDECNAFENVGAEIARKNSFEEVSNATSYDMPSLSEKGL
jgi:hypothetical protein